MTARFRHRAGIAAASLAGLMLGVLFMLALMWRFAQADPAIDPVVASDHAVRDVPTVAPADAPEPDPSLLDRALDVAGPVGRGALGGMTCLAVAWLLARCREHFGWLRRGWAGNAAATVYAALATFGAVVAVGGSVGLGLAAVGGAMAAGMGLAANPETARRERAQASGEDVPT